MKSYSRELIHGTVSGYIYRRCRCEKCLQAVRDYYGYKPRAQYDADREPHHGTESRYIHRKCRCEACRAAANEAKRERRRTGTVSTHNASGYSNGCRCPVCTKANTEKVKAWKRARRKAAT